jgi:predicted nucleotide-binding protein
VQALALKGNRVNLFESAMETITKSLEQAIKVVEDDKYGELINVSSMVNNSPASNRIFIGHGRSKIWIELRDFLRDRLKLEFEEFNRESSAGKPIAARLEEMLSNSGFAFLIMTAEDEHADSTLHARENVIHEVGLFQGKLGFNKAIVLLEDGCQEFSNIHGLGQIRFPKGFIRAVFEDIRQVLESQESLIRFSCTSGRRNIESSLLIVNSPA